MDRRTAPNRSPRRRLSRLLSPMTASVVGALFPLPRRLAPVHRSVGQYPHSPQGLRRR